MYLKYYQFRKEPFQVTPDPEFLFMSRSHKEALGSIIYGIEQRKGFIAILGEVGVGKTTILRSCLEKIDSEQLRLIYLFNANISFEDLLKTIYRELGIAVKATGVSDMVNHLYQVLIEEYKQHRKVVLAIDEAQNMPVDTLENLRMLSNLETSTEKLLQIILIGQPELDKKLNLKELRQFKQRIAVRSTIHPLSQEESSKYIQHRLTKAAVNPRGGPIFSPGALKLIINYGQGIPRVLNTLCSNALILGYAYQQKPISARVIKEILADLEGKGRRASLLLWAASAAVILITIGIFWSFQSKSRILSGTEERYAMQAPSMKAPAMVEKDLQPSKEEDIKPAPEEIEIKADALPVAMENTSEPPLTAAPPLAPVAGDNEPRIEEESTPPAAESEPAVRGYMSLPDEGENIGPPLKANAETRVVKRGDTLSRLLVEVYGYKNDKLFAVVQQANPQIQDVNKIWIGDEIHFPHPIPDM
jgi:general secretion pathway protein A